MAKHGAGLEGRAGDGGGHCGGGRGGWLGQYIALGRRFGRAFGTHDGASYIPPWGRKAPGQKPASWMFPGRLLLAWIGPGHRAPTHRAPAKHRRSSASGVTYSVTYSSSERTPLISDSVDLSYISPPLRPYRYLSGPPGYSYEPPTLASTNPSKYEHNGRQTPSRNYPARPVSRPPRLDRPLAALQPRLGHCALWPHQARDDPPCRRRIHRLWSVASPNPIPTLTLVVRSVRGSQTWSVPSDPVRDRILTLLLHPPLS
jgi:hypothetical protein